MEFSPSNNIVKRCLQGMSMEEQGQPEAAGQLFHQAWEEASNDFEQFLAAYYVARHQAHVPDQLKWFETALQLALKIDDTAAVSALPTLHENVAACYEDLNEPDKAKQHRESATSLKDKFRDKGPFYHGTKADLKVGALLTAGGQSNYEAGLQMNHIYFTALVHGAGLAASLAKGDGPERVYLVEPTGSFENDPNVTDKKFPGNLTRSYRSRAPLKIISAISNWASQTPEALDEWRQKLANNKGKIIN